MRPELLTHPNIPKALHGTNPRIILGSKWWNTQRQIAYAKEDYHCWACGIHQSRAEYHAWLEAHESFTIDYTTGRVELNEIVALCHACHNFIHSGRLWELYQKNEIPRDTITAILAHGFAILTAHKLQPFWGTRLVALRLEGFDDDTIEPLLRYEYPERTDETRIKWQEWRLMLNGQEYGGKFANYEEWEQYYNTQKTSRTPPTRLF